MHRPEIHLVDDAKAIVDTLPPTELHEVVAHGASRLRPAQQRALLAALERDRKPREQKLVMKRPQILRRPRD